MLQPCGAHYQYRADCQFCKAENALRQQEPSTLMPNFTMDINFASALRPDPSPDFNSSDGGASGGGGASSDF